MGPALMAILLIAGGAAVRVIGPSVGGGGLATAAMNTVVVIDVSEVGVKHFPGTVDTRVLGQGVHVINPLASVEKMSVREQSFPASRGIDQIKQSIVLNAIRNGVRDAVATKSIKDIFSPDRRVVAEDMKEAIQLKADDRIQVVEVFLRDVQAPANVRQAIDEKLQREQQVAAEKFQTDIIEEQALQEIAAAKGLAEAQQIISVGLKPEYLMFPLHRETRRSSSWLGSLRADGGQHPPHAQHPEQLT